MSGPYQRQDLSNCGVGRLCIVKIFSHSNYSSMYKNVFLFLAESATISVISLRGWNFM